MHVTSATLFFVVVGRGDLHGESFHIVLHRLLLCSLTQQVPFLSIGSVRVADSMTTPLLRTLIVSNGTQAMRDVNDGHATLGQGAKLFDGDLDQLF